MLSCKSFMTPKKLNYELKFLSLTTINKHLFIKHKKLSNYEAWNNVIIHPMYEKNPSVFLFSPHCFSSTQTGSVVLISHAFSMHLSLDNFANIPLPGFFLLQSYARQTNLRLLVKQKFFKQFSWLDSGSFWQTSGGWKKLLLQLTLSMAITCKMTNGIIIAREYMFRFFKFLLMISNLSVTFWIVSLKLIICL